MNCAVVVVVNFELEQWKSVEKNAEKSEILRMNDSKRLVCAVVPAAFGRAGGNDLKKVVRIF